MVSKCLAISVSSIEEMGAFLERTDADEIEGENHYSPWVETPRPLLGIVHAVYVYLPVFGFWSAILRDRAVDQGQLAYARESIARIPVQLRMGISQLQRHAKFTAFGNSIFRELEREVIDIEAEARELGADLKTTVIGIDSKGVFRAIFRPGDARPVMVVEMLIDHLERSDLRSECGAEKASLMLARG